MSWIKKRRYRPRKYKYVCPECGSEDVEFDSYGKMKWNKEKQVMEACYQELSDSGYDWCNDCEHDGEMHEVFIDKKRLNHYEKV